MGLWWAIQFGLLQVGRERERYREYRSGRKFVHQAVHVPRVGDTAYQRSDGTRAKIKRKKVIETHFIVTSEWLCEAKIQVVIVRG